MIGPSFDQHLFWLLTSQTSQGNKTYLHPLEDSSQPLWWQGNLSQPHCAQKQAPVTLSGQNWFFHWSSVENLGSFAIKLIDIMVSRSCSFKNLFFPVTFLTLFLMYTDHATLILTWVYVARCLCHSRKCTLFPEPLVVNSFVSTVKILAI